MVKRRIVRIGCAIAGAAALVGTGAAFGASTVSSGVKACVTSKQVLVGATSAGHCPAGTKVVTIAKQGPRGAKGAKGAKGATGARGPGAVAVVLSATTKATSKTVTLTNGDTVTMALDPKDPVGYPTARLTLTGKGTSVTDYAVVTGDVARGQVGVGDGTLFTSYFVGDRVLSTRTAVHQVKVSVIGNDSDTTGQGDVHLLVQHGTTVFTVDMAATVSASASRLVGELVPTS